MPINSLTVASIIHASQNTQQTRKIVSAVTVLFMFYYIVY